jgi:hypothetical protein
MDQDRGLPKVQSYSNRKEHEVSLPSLLRLVTGIARHRSPIRCFYDDISLSVKTRLVGMKQVMKQVVWFNRIWVGLPSM